MEIRVKKISPEAKLPLYQHAGDAGLDLFSAVNAVISTGEVKAIPTGIKMAIPEGHVGLIWDKSGLSLRGIHCLAGVVDAGYRGEVMVVMANLSHEAFAVEKGMKIAQMLIQPVVVIQVIEADELEETARGERGFGSTGRF